jgi:hypothetical protein
MKHYQVSTRNWFSKKWVGHALDYSLRFGVGTAGEGKYIFLSKNPYKSWAIWAYFQIIKPFSGGWTYIIRPGQELENASYRSIY